MEPPAVQKKRIEVFYRPIKAEALPQKIGTPKKTMILSYRFFYQTFLEGKSRWKPIAICNRVE